MVFTLLLSLAVSLAAPAEDVFQPDLLNRIDDAARKGFARGASTTRQTFKQNANAWDQIHRDIGVATAYPLWGAILDHRYVFPASLPKSLPPDQIPLLVARQTRVFSWLIWKAAELRQAHARTEDWRYGTFGRMLAKLRADVEDEFYEIAHREHINVPYREQDLLGIRAFAADLSSFAPSDRVAAALENVVGVFGAPDRNAYRTHRRTLLLMRGHLDEATQILDGTTPVRHRAACAPLLTH